MRFDDLFQDAKGLGDLQVGATIGYAPHDFKLSEREVRSLYSDATLIDLQMKMAGGLQAIRTTRDRDPAATLIVLTTHSGEVRALAAGVTSYLLNLRVPGITGQCHGIRVQTPRTVDAVLSLSAARSPGDSHSCEAFCVVT